MTDITPIHTSPARTVEAARMLMDWGKWLVTVQTAAITALGFIAKTSDLKLLLTASTGGVAVTLGVLAVISFVVSILHATYLLLFLPALVERVPEKLPEESGATQTPISLWHVRVPFAPGWQVGTFTANQTRFFLLGIALFAAAYVAVGFAAPK